jgi:hypothetical protein
VHLVTVVPLKSGAEHPPEHIPVQEESPGVLVLEILFSTIMFRPEHYDEDQQRCWKFCVSHYEPATLVPRPALHYAYIPIPDPKTRPPTAPDRLISLYNPSPPLPYNYPVMPAPSPNFQPFSFPPPMHPGLLSLPPLPNTNLLAPPNGATDASSSTTTSALLPYLMSTSSLTLPSLGLPSSTSIPFQISTSASIPNSLLPSSVSISNGPSSSAFPLQPWPFALPSTSGLPRESTDYGMFPFRLTSMNGTTSLTDGLAPIKSQSSSAPPVPSPAEAV